MIMGDLWRIYLVDSGWWFFFTPLKNDGVSNSWDDDIPNMMGLIKVMFQTTTFFLYLFALHAGLDIEASALSVRVLDQHCGWYR